MNGRAVEDAAARLRELRHEEWEELGLAALALGLAIVASQARPSFAMPLFLGGLFVGALGVRSLWRRWDLLDRLAGERDAYAIPEVLGYASRQATMERRQDFAASIRNLVSPPSLVVESSVIGLTGELEALAHELEDSELTLDPACAIGCSRLLKDLGAGWLVDTRLSPKELHWRVRQVRDGFMPLGLQRR